MNRFKHGAIIISVLLAGCGHMDRQDRNTAIGAAVGGVAGSALTGGSTAGTVAGAVAGGVVGNKVIKH